MTAIARANAGGKPGVRVGDSTLAEDADAILTLMAYLAVADGQIHDQEVEVIGVFAEKFHATSGARQRVRDVFGGRSDAQDLRVAMNAILTPRRKETLLWLVFLGHIDGNFTTREHEFVASIAAAWQLPQDIVARSIARAKVLAEQHTSRQHSTAKHRKTFAQRLVARADRLLGIKVTDTLAEIAGMMGEVRHTRTQLLLSGPEYDKAIIRCGAVSKAIFPVVNAAMRRTDQHLRVLQRSIESAFGDLDQVATRQEARTAREAVTVLRDTNAGIEDRILVALDALGRSIAAKERTIDAYTIAFMGKTKAGKSTLHAAVTGRGRDAIGVGGQRTTRFNRVYHWKNIRIIDTPGIGAPGGATDEEIAASVIDEADVVCYVVTNDSQQKSDFRFLKRLRDRAKPVVILLNIRHNVRDEHLRARFLKDPTHLFVLEGPTGIQGHLNRIKRYARQNYANDWFDIVPVALLPALMATEKEFESDAERLRKASRIQQFLDTLRTEVVNRGTLRRAQNLLGCSAADLHTICSRLATEMAEYERMLGMVRGREEALGKELELASWDAIGQVTRGLTEIFNDLKGAAQSFAEAHWDKKAKELERAWSVCASQKKISERITELANEAVKGFSARLTELLDEIGKELDIRNELAFTIAGPAAQDASATMKTAFKHGGNALFAAAAIVAFIPGGQVVAAVLGVVGLASKITSWFFDSKQEKRERAVKAICSQLFDQIEVNSRETNTKLTNELEAHFDDVRRALAIYLQQCAKGLAKTEVAIRLAREEISREVAALNKVYAAHAIAWALNEHEPAETSLNRVLAVEREPGVILRLKLPADVRQRIDGEQLERVLQERVELLPDLQTGGT